MIQIKNTTAGWPLPRRRRQSEEERRPFLQRPVPSASDHRQTSITSRLGLHDITSCRVAVAPACQLSILLAAIRQSIAGLKVNIMLPYVRTRTERNNKNNLCMGTGPSLPNIIIISGSARGPFSLLTKEPRTGFQFQEVKQP